ncbi:MAG: signal peptidase II [Oleiphilus sp.]|nr:MAG: signal peptidase II [Oleiphilus sp.]
MLPWLALSAVILVLDLVTKYLASSHLDYALPVNVIPGFFNLTLLHNTGAAFSFLATESGWQRWFFIALASLVSLALIKWLQTLQGDRWMAIAITLILGGALGNLYDRITLGYVVDFLHFFWDDYHFPAFNIADTAISIGAAMMILDLFRKHEDQEETESPRSE